MGRIERMDVDTQWAHSAVVEAGDFVFISYCMRNEGQPIQEQINGAFDVLAERLALAGLPIESVVKLDCLFKDIADLSFLAPIIEERFHGMYPARKAFETAFIRDGISFQIDAIAFRG